MLTVTFQYHLKNASDQLYIAENLRRPSYVENWLMGAHTFEEAKLLYEMTKVILADTGMPLRKWATNDQKLQEIFDTEEPVIITEGCTIEMPRETKALRMGWDSGMGQSSFLLHN